MNKYKFKTTWECEFTKDTRLEATPEGVFPYMIHNVIMYGSDKPTSYPVIEEEYKELQYLVHTEKFNKKIKSILED